MALPISVGSYIFAEPCGGPFKVGSSFYIVAQASGVNLVVLKANSDDPSSGWTEQDSSNRPSVSGVGGIHAVVRGTTIHIVTQIDGSTRTVEYHTFNTSTNTWGTTNESVGNATTGTGVTYCSIAVRSDGSVVVTYDGPPESNMGTNYARVCLAIRSSGGTWGSIDTSISNAGKNTISEQHSFAVHADDTNDRVHISYRGSSTATLWYSTLLSDNSFGHQGTTIDTSILSSYGSGVTGYTGVSFLDGSTRKIRFFYPDSGSNYATAGFNDADSPGTPTIYTGVSTSDSGTSGHGSAVNGTTQYCVNYHSGGTAYINSTGAGDDTWGTPATLGHSVTNIYSANSYTRGSSDVIAYLYSSSSTYYYNEYSLSTGYTLDATTAGSYAITGTAANLEQARTIDATTAGSYAMTGTAATLTVGSVITANAGSYSVSGTAATLTKTYRLPFGTGTSGQYNISPTNYTFGGTDLLNLSGTTGYLLLSGDAQSGTDRLLLSGDTGDNVYLQAGRTLDATTAGSYSVTGTDATFLYGYSVDATTGSYSVAGTAASLLHNHVIDATSGAYAITGTDATLQIGYVIDATTAGSYAINGTAASLLHGFLIDATTSSYTVTGTDATLTRAGGNKTIDALGGAYTISGTDATLEHGFVVSATSGSYTISGVDALLEQSRTVTATAGSYTITGTAASLLHGYEVSAANGSYAISGTAASLLHDFLIDATSGSYTVTGTDAVLDWSGSTGKTLVASGGSYAITGTVATLEQTRTLVASGGSYTVTGTAAGLSITARVVAASSGSYAVDGPSDAFGPGFGSGMQHGTALLYDRLIDATAGSYAITGTDASLYTGKTLAAASGAYSVNGTDVSLEYGFLVDAAGGSYAVTGTDVSLLYGHSISVSTGSYSINGTALSFLRTYTLDASGGGYTITGTDVSLEHFQDRSITAGAGSYAVTGTDASLLYASIIDASSGAYHLGGVKAQLTRSNINFPWSNTGGTTNAWSQVSGHSNSWSDVSTGSNSWDEIDPKAK